MKKVKIMLTSIAILAVVGGAVAFKANYYKTEFCTLSADKTTCPIIPAKTDPNGVLVTYTFPETPGVPCDPIDCVATTRTLAND